MRKAWNLLLTIAVIAGIYCSMKIIKERGDQRKVATDCLQHAKEIWPDRDEVEVEVLCRRGG